MGFQPADIEAGTLVVPTLGNIGRPDHDVERARAVDQALEGDRVLFKKFDDLESRVVFENQRDLERQNDRIRGNRCINGIGDLYGL